MAEIQVALGDRSYPVIVQHGLSARIPEVLQTVAPSKRYFVISDEQVWSLYAGIFPGPGGAFETCIVPAGESSKSMETLRSIWTFLLEHDVERAHVVVALGGGVVGDLAGFVAATVLRGVRLVAVPTTLLAQVDASIGGKTGINHPLGKNLIGAFHQPVAVLVDPAFLRTLPESELQSGMYEVIKYAVIAENPLYDLLTQKGWRGDGDLTAIIEECVRCKAGVVAADEKEGSRRMILNFGHTLGHAIEAAAGFCGITHGQAVGWGMLFATRLACTLGLCDRQTEEAIRRLISLNGDLPPLRGSAGALVDAMRHDKKVQDGFFTFVLPRRVGEVVIRRDVTQRLLQERLEEFLA